MAKLLFNISFSFLFFSFITKVEHRKILRDKSQSHKGVTMITEWSCHMRSQVTVTTCDKRVS